MAVAASSHGSAANVLSVSVSRPGAEDAVGTLYVATIVCSSDVSALPSVTGNWGTWYSSILNRFSLYGRYISTLVLARLGVNPELAAFDVYKPVGATTAKTALSATLYRISDPLNAAYALDNRGARGATTSTTGTQITWHGLSLQGSGSLVLDLGGMLTLTGPAAASLKLRTGSTEVARGSVVDADTPSPYYLAYGQGYLSGQSGTVAANNQTVSGNLGAVCCAIEVKQAAGGGGPPATGGGTGRVLYVGA